MNLQELEKKRDAYSSKIASLAIQIALIFAIPAGIAVLAYYFLEIRIVYTLPIAFILSWVLVIRLYQKVDKKVRTLEAQIRELKQKETSDADDEK